MVCTAPPSAHRQQLVERRPLDVGPATARRRASSGHHTVTRANGSPSARFSRGTSQHRVDAEHLPDTRPARRTNAKSRMRRSERTPEASSCSSMVPRRASGWRTGLAGHEPAEALPGVDQPLGSRSTSSALRIVTRLALYAAGQLGLARQQSPGGELAGLHPCAAGRRRSPGSGSCALVLYLYH